MIGDRNQYPRQRYSVMFFLNGGTVDADTVIEYVDEISPITASVWARDRAKELQLRSRTVVTWRVL